MTIKITLEAVRAHKPCEDQYRVFAETWPDGFEVTKENMLKFLGLKLDLWWLAASAGVFVEACEKEDTDAAD